MPDIRVTTTPQTNNAKLFIRHQKGNPPLAVWGIAVSIAKISQKARSIKHGKYYFSFSKSNKSGLIKSIM